jgi:hypothetical protein
VVQDIFDETTNKAFGSVFRLAISFRLRQSLAKDPFEVMLTDPATFYSKLQAILGEGVDTLLSLMAELLTRKYRIECSQDEFVQMVSRGDVLSKNRLAEIFAEVAKREKMKPEFNSPRDAELN